MQTFIFGDARSGFVADINTSVLLEGYPFDIMTVSNLESAINRKQARPDAVVLLSETLLRDADLSLIPEGAYAYSHTPEGEEYIASIGMTSLGLHKTSSSLLSVLDGGNLPMATPPHAPIQAAPEVAPAMYDAPPMPVAPNAVPAPDNMAQAPMYSQQPYEAPVAPQPVPQPAPQPMYPTEPMSTETPPMAAPAMPPVQQAPFMPEAPQMPQNPAMPNGMTPEMMQMMMQMMQQMQATQGGAQQVQTPAPQATPPQTQGYPQEQVPVAPAAPVMPETPKAPPVQAPAFPQGQAFGQPPQAPAMPPQGNQFGQPPMAPPFPNTPPPKAPQAGYPNMPQTPPQPQGGIPQTPPMAPRAPQMNPPMGQPPQAQPLQPNAYPQWSQQPQAPQNAWGQPNPYGNMQKPVQPMPQAPGVPQTDDDLGIVRPQAQFPERASTGSEIRGRKRRREQQTTDAAINQDLAGYGSPEPQGTKVITVYAAKGGVGKTTISTELAVCLALTSNGRRKFRVCIVDYNIDFGDVATTLELRDDGPNMSYWASEIREKIARGEDPNEINFTRQQMEERYLHRMNETGLYALTAPIAHEDSMLIKSDELKIMLRNIIDNGEFDFVVCDTGNNTRDSSIIAIDNSDYVFLVCTQDVTTANCNASVLRTLQDSSFDTNKIRLIINNVISSRDTGISVQEIEETFPYPCICRIKRTPNVIWANNNAKPVVYKQNHEFTKQLRKVVDYVTSGEGVADVPKSRGLFGR